MQTINIHNEEETKALAARLARLVKKGDVILLSGDLGAGKTTFSKHFICAVAKTDVNVTSPTYTLSQRYETNPPVWHFDLYRLRDREDSYELGLEEAFQDGVTLVEWPERA